MLAENSTEGASVDLERARARAQRVVDLGGAKTVDAVLAEETDYVTRYLDEHRDELEKLTTALEARGRLTEDEIAEVLGASAGRRQEPPPFGDL